MNWLLNHLRDKSLLARKTWNFSLLVFSASKIDARQWRVFFVASSLPRCARRVCSWGEKDVLRHIFDKVIASVRHCWPPDSLEPGWFTVRRLMGQYSRATSTGRLRELFALIYLLTNATACETQIGARRRRASWHSQPFGFVGRSFCCFSRSGFSVKIHI